MGIQHDPVSPHTRGWTHVAERDAAGDGGFPAHAGMDLEHDAMVQVAMGFPRTRGDGPAAMSISRVTTRVSPHTRGWTLDRARPKDTQPGFPAHAGMDPFNSRRTACRQRFPRTRGDGPLRFQLAADFAEVSPHTRGWTPMTCKECGYTAGFPAHAGMDRRQQQAAAEATGFPRTRGDGPTAEWEAVTGYTVSPHTRGWTHAACRPDALGCGFPAHAGMDPPGNTVVLGPVWFPRTRGDGPQS